MKKRLFAVLLLLLSAAWLSGCAVGMPEVMPSPLPSGVTPSPTPTLSPTTRPVEALVSHDEAVALVGNALKPAEVYVLPNDVDGMSHVFYDAGEKGGRFLQVTLHQRTIDGQTVPKDIYDRLERNTKPVKVEGVGDSAFIAAPGLHMMAQGYYVIIAVGDPGDAKNVEILKQAGQMVAEKIKAMVDE